MTKEQFRGILETPFSVPKYPQTVPWSSYRQPSQDGRVSVFVTSVTQCLLHTSSVNLNFGRIDNIQDIELHIIFPIVMP